MEKVEIILRFPDRPSDQAVKEMEELLYRVKLEYPDANVELTKLSNTSDMIDSLTFTVEAVYVGMHLYEWFKMLYEKRKPA
jgi:hypothetical protein